MATLYANFDKRSQNCVTCSNQGMRDAFNKPNPNATAEIGCASKAKTKQVHFQKKNSIQA